MSGCWLAGCTDTEPDPLDREAAAPGIAAAGLPVVDDGEPGDWRRVASGTAAPLFDVRFVDEMRGWVVGDGGTVLRTLDGGATWTPQPGFSGLLRSIDFVDAQHGWIAGHERLYGTTDGGATWHLHPLVPPRGADLSFVSSTTGWLASKDIYRTVDGGTTWQIQAPSSPDLEFHEVELVDELHGWALARAYSDGGDVEGTSIVFHTSDSGVTWERRYAHGNWQEGFTGIAAAGERQAWVVGVDRGRYRLGEYKHVTRDGVTWELVPDTTNGTALADVHFVDALVGWACGFGGSIIHTTDGGATWTPQATPSWRYDSGYTVAIEPSLYSIFFLDADRGWAVGDRGTILRTTHGGGTP